MLQRVQREGLDGERRDVTDSARGKVVVGERCDVIDSARGKGLDGERRDVTHSARGKWSLERNMKLKRVQGRR